MTAIKTILTVPDPFYLLKQLTSSIEGSKSGRQRERDIERDRNIERDIDCQKNHCYSHMILFWIYEYEYDSILNVFWSK